MDIHRSRFVPYPTFGISAVAFSRSSDDATAEGLPQPALKLAIGRANGDIELWNPQHGNWVQEAIFPGDNASIDGLLWTREADEKDVEGRPVLGQHRLFSIATSPTVTEWDLALGVPKRKSTGNFNQVWCFAAQPLRQTAVKAEAQSQSQSQSQDLVAGCIDGAIVLLSTADNDLQFKRFLARISGKNAKCVSITYQTRDRVLAGFADSTIRVLDIRNGSTIRTMSLGSSIPGAPKNKLVWQVRCLSNGDIVSGDSTGDVVFWDGKTYSLIQRLSVDESDCLDLVVSADGKSVFKGSLDGKITIFQHTTNTNGRQTWTKSHHRKIHQGEVKTMSAYDGNGMSVIVSGGSDLASIVTPLREFGKESSKSLVSLPQRSPVASARQARLLVSWWEQSISIWRIARGGANDLALEPQPSRKLVAKIELSTNDCIRSVAISEDGKVVAACTSAHIKVFQLRRRADADGLVIRKMEVPQSLAEAGARLLAFSPDGKWLAAVLPDNEVHLVRLASDPEKPKQIRILDKAAELERDVRQSNLQTGFEEYERTISRLAFSPDSSVLVAGDLSGYLDSWVLEGHEDLTAPGIDVTQAKPKEAGDTSDSDSSDDDDEEYVFFGQHWTDNPAGHLLPKLDSTPLVLSFRPSPRAAHGDDLVNGNPGVHSTRHNPHARSHAIPKGPHRLWVMTSRHQMYEFDVLAGKLSDWSRKNPTSALPEEFTKLTDRVIGAVWDVNSRAERLWLYGSSWLFMLNVGSDLQSHQSKKQRRPSELAPSQISKKQKTNSTNSGAGIKMPAHHRTGLPETVRRYEDGAWKNVALDKTSKPDDEMDLDLDDDGDARRLTRVTSMDDGQQHLIKNESRTTPERNWWSTLQYRSILGVVPLAHDGSVEDEKRPIEVVLVERPLWDARESKR